MSSKSQPKPLLVEDLTEILRALDPEWSQKLARLQGPFQRVYSALSDKDERNHRRRDGSAR